VETTWIRALQWRVSATIRRAHRGKKLGATDRGRPVAIIAPPSLGVGTANLIAAGRVRLGRPTHEPLPEPATGSRSTTSVLDDLRGEL
jgi:antitoxin (DNA-binding transcriptional repressor) of toxin-antitoxin stability system